MGKRKTCKKKCEKYPEYCFGEICFALIGILGFIFGLVTLAGNYDVGCVDKLAVFYVSATFFGGGLLSIIVSELMGLNHKAKQLIK